MKYNFLVISDIHGKTDEYVTACREAKYSLQLGDLIAHPTVAVANNETFEELNPYTYRFYETSKLDPNCHKFFGGNHDNYSLINSCPYNIGDYGIWDVPDVGRVFYVRGGFSLDWRDRCEVTKHYVSDGMNFYKPRNIWRDKEELSWEECDQAIEFYEKLDPKPDFVISHECPLFFVDRVTNPQFARNYGYSEIIKTRTNQMLERMYNIYQPKYWFFGHYHFNYSEQVDNTLFICIPKMGAIDINGDTITPFYIDNEDFDE